MAGRAAKSTPARAGRGQITDEARRRGAAAKSHRGTFNRYLKALQGPSAERTRARVAEIDETLARGTRKKKAPVFKDGRRVGTTTKDLPLLPSERATLMAKRNALASGLERSAPPELRAQFLAMLPDYAERNGLTREILIEVGVPVADLDEAGI